MCPSILLFSIEESSISISFRASGLIKNNNNHGLEYETISIYRSVSSLELNLGLCGPMLHKQLPIQLQPANQLLLHYVLQK